MYPPGETSLGPARAAVFVVQPAEMRDRDCGTDIVFADESEPVKSEVHSERSQSALGSARSVLGVESKLAPNHYSRKADGFSGGTEDAADMKMISKLGVATLAVGLAATAVGWSLSSGQGEPQNRSRSESAPGHYRVRGFSHGGEVRPEPSVRRKFDGVWLGSSGSNTVHLTLNDGYGTALIGPGAIILDVSLIAAGPRRAELAVQVRSEDIIFRLLARVTGSDSILVDDVIEWQTPISSYLPSLPLRLDRTPDFADDSPPSFPKTHPHGDR